MKQNPLNSENTVQDTEEGAVTEGTASVPAVKTKRVRKIFNMVLYGVLFAVLAFLIVVLVWIIVDKITNKSPVTRVFGYSFLVVETGSMSGTIEEGDLVIITKAEEYKVGDIITFLPEGDKIPTTHRIVRIVGDNFFTRGDANGNAEDPRPVTYENILGKVVSTVPKVGLFFRWFATDFGWIYFVGIVAIVAIGVVLIKKIPSHEDEK